MTDRGRAMTIAGPAQELSPYLFPSRLVEVVVPQREMNPAKDCLVKLQDAICGQEHDPLAILQLAEEHGDQTVADQVLIRATLEVDVSFVEEKDSTPMLRDLEDLA